MKSKIEEIKESIKNTKKNKSTEKYLSELKTKLSKYSEEKGSKTNFSKDLFSIKKKEIMVGLLGLPNVGKSSLFNILLNYERSKVSNYQFTTKTPIEGIVNINEIKFQIIDFPGIIKTDNINEGKIKAIISNILYCNIVFIVLDYNFFFEQYLFIKKILKEWNINQEEKIYNSFSIEENKIKNKNIFFNFPIDNMEKNKVTNIIQNILKKNNFDKTIKIKSLNNLKEDLFDFFKKKNKLLIKVILNKVDEEKIDLKYISTLIEEEIITSSILNRPNEIKIKIEKMLLDIFNFKKVIFKDKQKIIKEEFIIKYKGETFLNDLIELNSKINFLKDGFIYFNKEKDKFIEIKKNYKIDKDLFIIYFSRKI